MMCFCVTHSRKNNMMKSRLFPFSFSYVILRFSFGLDYHIEFEKRCFNRDSGLYRKIALVVDPGFEAKSRKQNSNWSINHLMHLETALLRYCSSLAAPHTNSKRAESQQCNIEGIMNCVQFVSVWRSKQKFEKKKQEKVFELQSKSVHFCRWVWEHSRSYFHLQRVVRDSNTDLAEIGY